MRGISRHYQYDDADDNRYTLRTTQTDYSTRYYQPTETRTFVQGGSVIGTRYSYPQDFTATIDQFAAPELRGIQTLKNQNVHEPVEIISFRQNVGDVRKYKTGTLTTFTAITLVLTKEIGVAHQVYLSETGSSQTSYQASADRFNSSGASNSFPIDPVWQQPRITMKSYDGFGNLTSYSMTAGITNSYAISIYTQENTYYPFVTGETKNYAPILPASAQVSAFTYTIPILGVSTITDPRGVTITYEYDSFGRLVRIKDKDGKILKQFTYRYSTSTEPQP